MIIIGIKAFNKRLIGDLTMKVLGCYILSHVPNSSSNQGNNQALFAFCNNGIVKYTKFPMKFS